ncbi:uncharacterized protein SOCE26_014560 [Sorangium cellulosum]|uniref:Tc1-like transposase DDE domain-containing protein n=1 Tax=Sorangium cellulosum TaxID=56 RepID=A0A2L0EL96_SORCE|nr:uncharacterized protein SOCE26_014560 [Sorangium cellulosum]
MHFAVPGGVAQVCYRCGQSVEHLQQLTDEVVEWFEEHPRWTLHCTPKHASWLNQIECAFSDLQRCVLARGSFRSKDELRDKVHAYLWWHNERAEPFEWTYRPASWSAIPGKTSDGPD